MMNFMVSGSLVWDIGERDTMPFPQEDAIMMVYGGRPPLGRCRMYNLSSGTPTHCSWDTGDIGV
jgi:hypothetical protein